MPITVHGATGVSSSGASAPIAEAAASPQDGDIQYLFGCCATAVSVSLPSNWDMIYQATPPNSTANIFIASRIWTPGIGSQSITYSPTAYYGLEFVSLGGADTNADPQLAFNASGTSGKTLTAAGLTPTDDDGLLLVYYSQTVQSGGTSATLSLPTGLTALDNRSAGAAAGYPIRLASKAITSQAATGSFVSTASASGPWRAATMFVPALPDISTAQFFPFF